MELLIEMKIPGMLQISNLPTKFPWEKRSVVLLFRYLFEYIDTILSFLNNHDGFFFK